MQYTEFHAINSRMLQLTDELSAGCDPEFDAYHEELEREFAEIRLFGSTSVGR
jgi:hypothetical protein